MKMFRRFLGVSALAVLAAGALAPAAQAAKVTETVAADSRFSTFAQAIRAAGLETLLESSENVTVFAPTNEAFQTALPPGTLENLLLPENRAQLREVLLQHISFEAYPSSELPNGISEIGTGNLNRISVNTLGDDIKVAGLDVVEPDITVDNGVIHAINGVIVPPSDPPEEDVEVPTNMQ